jgi:hypothetical protein
MRRSSPDDGEGTKLFTVAEANALLPEIVPILIELRDLKGQLDAAKSTLDRLTPVMRGNGHGAEAIVLERQLADLMVRIVPALKHIAGLGVEIKDLDQGLIDFRSVRDGRIVYLCWRLGEDEIAYWHDLDAGFAGRQPI